MLNTARIRELLREEDEARRLVVTPLLDPEKQVPEGAASIDVRLGTHFRAAKRSNLAYSDPVMAISESDAIQDDYYVPLGGVFVLHPRHFVLGTTLEYVRLPPQYGAYVVGRSVLGRLGLIIATAVGIHPGYAGIITLELTNLGEVPIRLYPGVPIAQLFIHSVEGAVNGSGYQTQFAGDVAPRSGDLADDRVVQRIKDSLKWLKGQDQRTVVEPTERPWTGSG